MEKIVIFDWGGVIIHHYPADNNAKDAIIRIFKSFNPSLTDEEAYHVYTSTLKDENGIYISQQNDKDSFIKWVNRIEKAGNFKTTFPEFYKRFSEEYKKTGYYKEVVSYVHSLKERGIKIGLFSDLICTCYEALNKQVDLSKFDYVWLSYMIHFRKNSEEAFIIVERTLNVLPENILFIDDTTVNIENAKKRGWQTCQATGDELEHIKDAVEQFLNNEYDNISKNRIKG